MQDELHYAILKDRQVIPVAHCAWQGIEERRVAETRTPIGTVSTVFLNLNHGIFEPGQELWFESMAFDSDGNDLDCERYATYNEAVQGHQRMCEKFFGYGELDADTLT